jgi:RimJ/RimL family protein N-acetyltransferase
MPGDPELTSPRLADIGPLTLTGRRVTVAPLTHDDAADLYEFGRHERLWTWMPRTAFTSVDDAHGFIDQALEEQRAGRGVPFTIRLNESRELIGHLRYLDPQPLHGSVEIGWVMIVPDRQRGKLAMEASLLLFEYALETLGATRVWMKTDARNEPAKRTMELAGMTYEGTLRRHGRVRDGYIRDSAIYSFIADEWDEKKGPYRRIVEAAAAPAAISA